MSSRSVLVVDDSSVDREIVSIVCSALGCEVEMTADGDEAVSLFAERRHGVVLTDYRMEPVDGVEVISRIRAMDPAARCIVMTGYPDAKIRTALAENGISDLLTKPIDARQLRETIRSALSEGDGARQSRSEIALSNRMDECAALAGESTTIRSIRKELALLLDSPKPVLIEGPPYLGKADLARLLHENGAQSNGELVICDFRDDATEDEAARLFGPDGEDGPAILEAAGGTVLLNGAERIPLDLQRRLTDRVTQNVGDPRFLFIADQPLDEGIDKGTIESEFYFAIALHMIAVPGFADREEDIAFAAAFVGERPGRFGLARALEEPEIERLARAVRSSAGSRNYDAIVQAALAIAGPAE